MTYQLKGGEEWRDGKLYGWTGKTCIRCNGRGESYHDNTACGGCSRTGEEWGLMPVQPAPMSGLFATLTDEQKQAALDYYGPEDFGDPNYRK